MKEISERKKVSEWKGIRDPETGRRLFFCLSVLAAFVLIFIFNVLTPMMTDDLFYSKTVSEASSVWELFGQEYEQYMTWTGRSVCHMILRFFLLTDKMFFNVANSVVFVLLTLLIYWNVEHKKKYDTPVFLLVNLLVWMFGVVFRQTVLWETGACNYLWGSAIILSFITLYRYGLKRESASGQGAGKPGVRHPVLWTVFLPILGVLAGWCNENTSGGGLLMTLLCLFFYLYERKRDSAGSGHALKPWMATGLIGNGIGLAVMVLAPGNAIRAQVQEEEHSGLLGYMARFQKITLAVRENFLLLLIIGILLFIIVYYQKKSWKALWAYSRNGILWAFVFLATCYALVLTPEPQARAYFGAGIFLTIAVVQFFVDVSEKEVVFASLKTGLISVMLLIMFFTYMDSGANLARIYREYHERDVYLAQKAEEGAADVTVPMLRPDFETKYSDGYNSDIREDPGYWINVAYATYYGFNSVSGVPREGWTDY
ncbi:MAG TPA: hypothetical protein H9717_11550 [Candidatus Eisenbergiella merdipullorum]|uniref:Uncharacterized protein n=1 Tax=Candidatus Eisenbergiella merdipullorum TaxID=2838553 RepID=A0A9D2I7W1_9FIRM|nr:hypothetical protein [Candidatus Eisenbergiella merdipullorum]